MNRWKIPLMQAIVLVAVIVAAGPFFPAAPRPANPPPPQPEPVPVAVPAVDSTGTIAMEVLPSQGALLAGQPSDLFLAIRLSAADPGGSRRPPLNLSIVLDKSGSMTSARKIEYARNAAKMLVDRLLPTDILSVVVYDSEVELLVPAGPVADPARVRAAIDRIEPNGSTNLSGGLQRGAEEVAKNIKQGQINRVLLMTDGLANNGETDARKLAAMAHEWLGKGVSISTFGLGAEFNEDLLQTMAESAAGQYYFIESPDQMSGIYESEVKDLAKTAAREAVLTISPATGVDVREVIGYSPERTPGGFVLPLGDLYGGRTRKVVVKLTVAAARGSSRELAKISLDYRDVAAGRPAHASVASQVALFADAEKVYGTRDRRVLELSESAQAGASLDSAMRLLQKGQREEARRMLAGQLKNTRALNDKEIRSVTLGLQVQKYEDTLKRLDETQSDEAMSVYVKQNKVMGLKDAR